MLLISFSLAYIFLKGQCIKLKIIVHYPETTEEAEILKKKVAQVHAESVIQHVSKLNCNNDEKVNMIDCVNYSVQSN